MAGGEVLTWATPPSSRPPKAPPIPTRLYVSGSREDAAPVLPAISKRINRTIDWLSCTWRGTEGNQWSAEKSLFITRSEEIGSRGLFCTLGLGVERAGKAKGIETLRRV